jgi:RNA polymerase sigma factor (sigma-70 family)
MDDTPKSLLQRVQDGSHADDWRRLAELYTPFLERIVQHFGVFGADREDIVQDVLTIIVARVGDFRHNEQRGAFRRWLRTITVNRIRQISRSARQHTNAAEALTSLPATDDELERLWDQEHDVWVVRRLLALLEPEFTASTWQAFCRQVMDGAPAAQVAAELSLSVNAVQVAKSRVLRRLREEARGLID